MTAKAPGGRPRSGYVGGPYKVIAADFTGDGKTDLAISYYPIDALTIEAGDGKGRFRRLAINTFACKNKSTIEPIFNIAQGDVDGDGLPDLAAGVGGSPQPDLQKKLTPEELKPHWAGCVIVAKNMGRGRFKSMAQFPVESQAKGVRLADLDKDGRLDLLYTARGANYPVGMIIGKLYIRQGLGDWKFGPALGFDAGRSAYYVETADLNNDGFLDILVPNEHAPMVQYWLNPGRDIFKNPSGLEHHVVTATRIPGKPTHCINDVRAADLDGDGNLDLVTANLGTGTLSVFPGNGDGTFGKDTLLDGGKYNAFLAVADLDKDGDLDIAVSHWAADTTAVLLNKGNGDFAPRKDYKTAMRNYGLAIFDADGDGNLDIVTANYVDRSISLLRGKGDGTFYPAVTTPKGLRLVDGRWVPE